MILHREGSPIYELEYVSGLTDFFKGKLHKGETAYYQVSNKSEECKLVGDIKGEKIQYEIVGYDSKGNEAHYELKGNSFVPNIYIYRMTMTNEDGNVVEYSPDLVRYRCEEMGCKSVPVFWHGYLGGDGCPYTDDCGESECNIGKCIKEMADMCYEKVLCRIVNRPSFCAFEHNNKIST